MKTKVYNLEGKSSSDVELNDKVFGVEVKPEVVHEVFVAISNNKRQPWAHTKDKSEVSGGGRKPWKQKGTGRARHGSNRSPIWVGGGITFGPRNERNYKTKINKKTRRLALKMTLSDRFKSKALWVMDNFDFSEPKTKVFVDFLSKLPAEQKTFLILTDEKDDKLMKMTDNLEKIDVMRAGDVNVYTLLNHQGLIMSKDAVAKLEEILTK